MHIRVHEYAWVFCVPVLWLPLRGRQQFCRQVNPALGLSIKLSDQRINNSDSSLSGSITEHRLRGRQRHDKGTEVIYSLIQLAHIQIKMDADSLCNCQPIHSFKSQPQLHTPNAQKQENMRIHKFTHTQRATPWLQSPEILQYVLEGNWLMVRITFDSQTSECKLIPDYGASQIYCCA